MKKKNSKNPRQLKEKKEKVFDRPDGKTIRQKVCNKGHTNIHLPNIGI